MGKRNENLIRYGDMARVIRPLRYIRTGYPLNPLIAADKLIDEHESEIIAFLKSVGMSNYVEGPASFLEDAGVERIKTKNRAVIKFLHGLGFLYTDANNMGGKDRSVFKEPHPYLAEGQLVTAWDHNNRMTGEYFPPAGGFGGYCGEDDWFEPGGLKNQKQNRIVEVSVFSGRVPNQSRPEDHRHAEFHGLWMDTADLQKLTEEEVINAKTGRLV